MKRDGVEVRNSFGLCLKNASHGGVRGVIFLGNTLILVPLLLHSLGKEQFAILALVTPFLRYGFNGVFDFGVATGVVRHTSRSFATSDRTGTNEYVSSALLLYVVFGAALIFLYYLAGRMVVPLLVRGSGDLGASAQMIIGRAVWIYLLFSLSNPFFAVLMGAQKVEATHWIGTASLLIELGGMLLLVPMGITIARAMWVYAANGASSLIFAFFLARRYVPGLEVRWKSVSLGKLKEILAYGAQFSATTLAAILNPILDKLILARFAGLSMVALYEAAARLVDLLRRAIQLFLLPLFPLAGARQETRGEGERGGLYFQAFWASLLVSCGLYLVPASLALGIFRVWLGPESRMAALIFLVLCVTAFFQAVVGPLSMILLGTGRLKPLILTALVSLLINLTLSPALGHYGGLAGVLCGTFLAYGVVSVMFLIWSFGIAEFSIPAGRLARIGTSSVIAALLPGLILTYSLHLGERSLGLLKFLVLAGFTSVAFVMSSLMQADARRMASRVIDAAFDTARFQWLRRKFSSA